MSIDRRMIARRAATGVTAVAWGATALLFLLDSVVAEPETCSSKGFADSPALNTSMAVLLIAMVAGTVLGLPTSIGTLVAGRQRRDARLTRSGRNALIAAILLLPVAFFVLIVTVLRGLCFTF